MATGRCGHVGISQLDSQTPPIRTLDKNILQRDDVENFLWMNPQSQDVPLRAVPGCLTRRPCRVRTLLHNRRL